MRYGGRGKDRNTIHATEYVDVETDRKGNVVAVWFRCALLPFEQHKVDKQRANEMRNAATAPLISVELDYDANK